MELMQCSVFLSSWTSQKNNNNTSEAVFPIGTMCSSFLAMLSICKSMQNINKTLQKSPYIVLKLKIEAMGLLLLVIDLCL